MYNLHTRPLLGLLRNRRRLLLLLIRLLRFLLLLICLFRGLLLLLLLLLPLLALLLLVMSSTPMALLPPARLVLVGKGIEDRLGSVRERARGFDQVCRGRWVGAVDVEHVLKKKGG